MKETFIILGWFFAISLVLFTSLSFMASTISGFFPFSRESINTIKCDSRYIEVIKFDDCRSSCLEKFKVDSYKIENDKCFCDVNKC